MQVPCDPKILLPPFNKQELAAFHLTSLEREMKRDMLFETDLGIPVAVLDIDQFMVPEEPDALQLHPADAALLQVGP
jgi:hypothetical protein